MEYREIGKTGKRSSIIGLGCENLDGKPFEQVQDTVNAALENGINLFDVFMPGNEIRENIARALGSRRDQVMIQGHIGSTDIRQQYDISRDLPVVKKYFENLLRIFGYIDFGMMFFIDSEEDYKGVFETGFADYVQKLKRQGDIRHIGFSSHNPVMATRVALKMGDYVITEAGFGADLGAEKFLDIKCRLARLHPDAVVVVATVRALKHHGGCPKAELGSENLAALEAGLPNLLQHVANITEVYGLPCVVAVNRFPTDTEAELELVENRCRALGVNVALSEVWAKGGEGGVALAEEVIRLCDAPNHFTFSYELDASIEDKLAAIVTKVYHGDGVVLTPTAQKQAAELTELGFGSLPICMAKTQYSFSDNAALLGAPRGFTITVRNIKVSAGAGFLVALTGDIMTMPGLPKVPAAEKVDVDENGRISGLF